MCYTTSLSHSPRIKGYPHLFVLDADGKLQQSENMAELGAEKALHRRALPLSFLHWRLHHTT
ncbi:MAG TPA: hypothetical protein VF472_14095 [Burkholderiaceae bacterium]